MLAAAHFDSLIFLLLVGAAALMRFLAKKAGSSTEDDESPPPRIDTPPSLPRQESQTDEERIRKFLEALGQPTSSRPPPPVRPRTAPPIITQPQRPHLQDAERSERPRKVFNPLPPLTTVPPFEEPRRTTVAREMPTPPPPLESPLFEVQQDAPAPPPVAPTVSELVEAFTAATQSTPVIGSKSDLLSFLKTPEALRQAIILREIFGPPRSLQPFDLAGNA
jgi:hypothetical protein